jgi:NhaP-type Na+/H+ or K+/H+ antiporter
MLIASGADATTATAIILILGVGSLLLASRLKIPSILLLLPAGVIAGPVTGVLDPDEQFGSLLFPLISLGVGLLLFEGGLSLRFERTRNVRTVVVRLVTIGAFITWIVGWIGAKFFFDVNLRMAALIGAVLVVSGPTVVIPLLRLAQPRHSVAEVLRWEGIVIDPVGATLAVVVLDAVIEEADPLRAMTRAGSTLLVGGLIGLSFGALFVAALQRHIIPDHLQNPIALSFAVASFALANLVRPEAGLMATTTLGLLLANQKRVPARHVLEFAEDVSFLVLGALFLVLGARVDLDELADIALPALGLTLLLVLVARPLTVLVSTLGSGMSTNERLFLMCVAPRGIVAAAVSSVFALELAEAGIDPGPLAPITMVVIVATVVLYGFGAVPLARILRIARPPKRAIAIVGGSRWHLEFASALQELGIVTMIFTDRQIERRRAGQMTLLAYDGDLQSEDLEEAADALGVGTVLVLSDRTELVTAAVSRLGHIVGRSNIYALRHSPGTGGVGAAITTRPAFDSVTAQQMDEAMATDGEILVAEPGSLITDDTIVLASVDEASSSVSFGSSGTGTKIVATSTQLPSA